MNETLVQLAFTFLFHLLFPMTGCEVISLHNNWYRQISQMTAKKTKNNNNKNNNNVWKNNKTIGSDYFTENFQVK